MPFLGRLYLSTEEGVDLLGVFQNYLGFLKPFRD